MDIQSEAKSIWEDFFGENKVYNLKIQESSLKFLEFSIKNNKASTKTFDEAKDNIIDDFLFNNLDKFKKSKYLIYMLYSEEALKTKNVSNN